MDSTHAGEQQEPSFNPDDLYPQFDSTPSGLSSEEAQRRLQQDGPNALSEQRTSPLLQFLGYFWGPIPWMIEVAAILSAIVGHWADLTIILVLLVFNGLVGFYQEYQAGNAVEQLKKKLALKARARRDGKWQEINASELVRGDVVKLRLGDVIPADVKLLEGDYLSIDQSALTGESLPVDKGPGEDAYSGSVTKQGEMTAIVSATGMNTYFGKTARMVNDAKTVSHFQRAILTIGDYLIYMTLGLVAVLILVELHRGMAWMELAQFALILTVAAIPVAMPAVLSVTMAVGALALSKMQAIVSRLESIEEMAGMDILCSDKTGTLTQNTLTLGDPVLLKANTPEELIQAAALASETENGDAIDTAVFNGLPDGALPPAFEQVHFTPFDPVSKRSEAVIRGPEGESFRVTKGSPQVILALCGDKGDLRQRVDDAVDEFASRGFRTLGIARSDEGKPWSFLGILPLFDPPRADAADTIDQAQAHGVQVKMVTGDNISIAREIGRKLGLGRKIYPSEDLTTDNGDHNRLTREGVDKAEEADGFAQVFPEHKYAIVRALQSRNHLVGMTGDGVNDAPALKQADVGVAVSGATDAARAAADLVLTAPGLSVIISAVEEARRIFERMNSYAIYRITETIRIMFFVVLAMLVYNFYPITAIMIILLALLNDVPIMTIAYDNTWLDPNPVRWNMRRILTVSTLLGGIGVVETFGLLYLAKSWLGLDQVQIQSLIFLKLAIAGHLTLFVARTKRPFLTRPYPSSPLLWSAVVTKVIATLVVGLGWFVAPIAWSQIAFVWAYCIVWVFIEDAAKLMVYRHMEFSTARHSRFLDLAHTHLGEHGPGRR